MAPSEVTVVALESSSAKVNPSAPVLAAPLIDSVNVALMPYGDMVCGLIMSPAADGCPSVVSVAVSPDTTAVPLADHVPLAKSGRVWTLPPIPLSGTVTVPPLVVTERLDVKLPVAVGAKLTGTVMEEPGATVAPVAGTLAANGAEGVVAAVTVSVALPVLVRVIVWLAVEPTVSPPKSSAVGAALSGWFGGGPEPVVICTPLMVCVSASEPVPAVNPTRTCGAKVTAVSRSWVPSTVTTRSPPEAVTVTVCVPVRSGVGTSAVAV